jgi:DNA-binding transcriptional MerR regulator
MTNEERKQLIKDLLAKGLTLSQIQDHLHKEKNDPITYMDLRLLLSEMPDAKLPEKETPKTVLPTDSTAASAGTRAAPKDLVSPEPAAGGRLSISVDQTPAPGSMLSGYARFSSGAKAHWFLDEMGRLGLEPELGTGKPTQADMQEFSAELRRMLQQTGGM